MLLLTTFKAWQNSKSCKISNAEDTSRRLFVFPNLAIVAFVVYVRFQARGTQAMEYLVYFRLHTRE